ncbi:MAG: metal-dependent hydrolase [Saprospiraceae bacterium]
MDSITQIVLGAAAGELVLGRKAGNRAMLWGGIAGTIPDLDVFANAVADELSALAFHRAITHSLTFSIIVPFGLGYLIHRMYDAGLPKKLFFKDVGIVGIGLFLFILLGTLPMPIPFTTVSRITLAVTLSILFFPLLLYAREQWRRKPSKNENPSRKDWTWLFFWSIFTHPVLDCCTTYGTQFFRPFLDTRVAFNNISVADPAYTLPFLLFVLAASFFSRHRPVRRTLNLIGVLISSAYMLFTFWNYFRVKQVFQESLAQQGIAYTDLMISPTILNNILWQGVAESDTAFYLGNYSILDHQANIPSFTSIPKQHHLLAPYKDQRAVKILKWFSNGYFNVLQLPDGRFQLNDLRFGTFGEFKDENSYIFKFILKDINGELEVFPFRDNPPDMGKTFNELIERIKGR